MMMLNLYEKFITLNTPNDETNIQAIKFNNNLEHRVGQDYNNNALILFKINNPDNYNEDHSRDLSNLKIRANISCTIFENEKKIQDVFTVFTCKSSDSNLIKIFFIMIESMIESHSANLTNEDLSKYTEDFIELFSKIKPVNFEKILGLWGELFLINYSSAPEILIEAWHNKNNEKFDFYDFGEIIEVKCTLRNDRIHRFDFHQLNSNENIITIASIRTRETIEGISILDLRKKIEQNINDASFIFKLRKKFYKTLGLIEEEKLSEYKFNYEFAERNINFYEAINVPKVSEIPNYVSNIKFNSNLDQANKIEQINNNQNLLSKFVINDE